MNTLNINGRKCSTCNDNAFIMLACNVKKCFKCFVKDCFAYGMWKCVDDSEIKMKCCCKEGEHCYSLNEMNMMMNNSKDSAMKGKMCVNDDLKKLMGIECKIRDVIVNKKKKCLGIVNEMINMFKEYKKEVNEYYNKAMKRNYEVFKFIYGLYRNWDYDEDYNDKMFPLIDTITPLFEFANNDVNYSKLKCKFNEVCKICFDNKCNKGNNIQRVNMIKYKFSFVQNGLCHSSMSNHINNHNNMFNNNSPSNSNNYHNKQYMYQTILSSQDIGDDISVMIQLSSRKIAIGLNNGNIIISKINNFIMPNEQFINIIDSLNEHTSSITSLLKLTHTKHLVSGSKDNKIIIWHKDASIDNKYKCKYKIEQHVAPISVLLQINDYSFISSSVDGRVKFWDMSNDTIHNKLSFGTRGCMTASALLPNEYIVYATERGCLYLWNTKKRSCDICNGKHEGNVNKLVYVDNTDSLISIGNDKAIKVWKREAQNEIFTMVYMCICPYACANLILLGDNNVIVNYIENKGIHYYHINDDNQTITEIYNNNITNNITSVQSIMLCNNNILLSINRTIISIWK